MATSSKRRTSQVIVPQRAKCITTCTAVETLLDGSCKRLKRCGKATGRENLGSVTVARSLAHVPRRCHSDEYLGGSHRGQKSDGAKEENKIELRKL